MTTYIARVSLKYAFAGEMMNGLGAYASEAAAMIPEENNGRVGTARFSFSSFILDAENRNACADIMRNAFSAAFPGQDAVSGVTVTEYDEEDEKQELLRHIYNNFYGVEDYISLVTELADCVSFLGEKDAVGLIRKTNYVFAMDRGCGFTTLLSSLADFLRRIGAFPEEESEKRTMYVEFELGAETGDGRTSPDDFIDFLKSSSEDNKYGAVGVDVSYFLEKSRHDALRRFLRRLDPYQDSYVFVFRIPFLEKNVLDETAGILSDMMIVRTVRVPPYDACVLTETFWDELNGRSFSPDISLIGVFADRIMQEKADGRFYGFKTAEKLAGEVMLRKAAVTAERKAAGDGNGSDVISADDLPGYVDRKVFAPKGYAALSELVGMEKIEKKIREIIAQVKLSAAEGGPDRPCMHMRFTGAPGTGKTTVARIIGQIMKEEGILRKGAFLEYTGRDLCAEYVGQTAVKTMSICRDSYGSVLFIDEAYSLYSPDKSSNDYGREAIATLVSEMENHRDDMLVIMAGYTDEMANLMRSNPGLRSRMPYIIEFPNYTRDQLFGIFMLMVRKHFRYSPDLEEEAKRYFGALSDEMLGSKEFANARFVRNLYERTWSKCALRCSLSGVREIELRREDFIAASAEKEFSEKLVTKNRIGF
ncbi:MAG: AAA family ATPase [Clostridia bacterium]|nr:AAA family ATPase [Clostridia bacterium]